MMPPASHDIPAAADERTASDVEDSQHPKPKNRSKATRAKVRRALQQQKASDNEPSAPTFGEQCKAGHADPQPNNGEAAGGAQPIGVKDAREGNAKKESQVKISVVDDNIGTATVEEAVNTILYAHRTLLKDQKLHLQIPQSIVPDVASQLREHVFEHSERLRELSLLRDQDGHADGTPQFSFP